LGSVVGGVVAQAYGVVAVFWAAAAAMALVAVGAWRPLGIASATFAGSAGSAGSAVKKG
jgi:hypothetical protein